MSDTAGVPAGVSKRLRAARQPAWPGLDSAVTRAITHLQRAAGIPEDTMVQMMADGGVDVILKRLTDQLGHERVVTAVADDVLTSVAGLSHDQIEAALGYALLIHWSEATEAPARGHLLQLTLHALLASLHLDQLLRESA